MSSDLGVEVDEPGDNLEGNSEIEIDASYERAKKHALAMMRPGFHMGGGPYPGRDELHERHPKSSAEATPNNTDQNLEQ